jgi:short-subunit dehydrogenase
MPTAIIIGATSGIGRALALQLAKEGYRVGIAGRREALLDSLLPQLGEGATKRVLDLSAVEPSVAAVRQWIEELGHVELAVITATYSQDHLNLEWEPIYQSILTNVLGTTAVTNVFMEHFLRQGAGHLVVFTSLAEIRGNDERPAYGASKAFISIYAGGFLM